MHVPVVRRGGACKVNVRSWQTPPGRAVVVPMVVSFMRRYRWMSNFHEADVWLPEETLPNGRVLPGRFYPTTEHAYMAWKVWHDDWRVRMLDMKAYKVKAWSEQPDFVAAHRPDYDDVGRVRTMLLVVRDKFMRHPELAARLLATGNSVLVEGTTWKDRLFGVDLYGRGGQNWLGRILMQVRDELRAAQGLPLIMEEPLEVQIEQDLMPLRRRAA